MTKYPFTKIISLVPYEFKYKVSEDGEEYVIPAAAAGTTIPTITYNTNSIGAWKTDADSSHKDYIAVFERASRKKTLNLPDPADPTASPPEVADKIYFVTAEVAAVGRKIEGRKDLLTAADLIRARYNNNRYVRFLKESAVPAN
jgi:hypothetical protein